MSKSKSKDMSIRNETGKQPDNSPADVLAKMDELVERRSAINNRIAEIKSEYGSIYSNRQRFQTAIYNLTNRLGGMSENEKRFTVAREELTAELKQVREDTAQNEERCKALDEEIKQLETIELPACMIAICAEDVMEHHRQIKQALAVAEGIQELIDAQNQLIAKAKAANPNVANRQQERYNLLADIAMGNAGEKDLKDLDAVIAKEQREVSTAEKEAEPLIEKANATVSGLERKLATANKTLQALESKSSEVAHRYFMGEAEKVAVQYVNSALILKEQHQRLLGLDLILSKHGGRGIVRPGARPIQIPLFLLPQFDGLDIPNGGDGALLNGDRIYGDQINQAADTEEARLDAIATGHFYS